MSCSICKAQLSSNDERSMTLCTKCAKTEGVVPIPPLTRPPTPCKQCNARRFVRAIPREHSGARSGDFNRQISAPMFVTHDAATIDVGIFSPDIRADGIKIEETGHGMLEMFICTKCGLVEWYVPTVNSIPIHPVAMTEIVDYDDDKGPYR